MKMHFLFVGLLVCLLLGLSVCQEANCAEDVNQCLQYMPVFDNDRLTARDQIVLCTKSKEFMSCLDNYLRCLPPTDKFIMRLKNAMAYAKTLAQEPCQPEPTQEGNVPCIKNISLSEYECASQYRRLVLLPENLKQMQSDEEVLNEGCCAMIDFQSCDRSYAFKNCVPSGVQILRDTLDDIYYGTVQEYCENYYKDTCYQVSYSPRTAVKTGFFLYSALVMNILLCTSFLNAQTFKLTF